MATSQIASMLDELMGRNRNVDPDDDSVKELEWSDSSVCPFYLVQFCPHDLFTNTKADLGPCPKIHDDNLKSVFASVEDSNSRKCGYVSDFLRFCQRMLSELASRIKKAKERLLLTQKEAGERNKDQEMIKDKIALLTDKINGLVTQAENEGTQGNVEAAQGILKLTDTLREERDEFRNSLNAGGGANHGAGEAGGGGTGPPGGGGGGGYNNIQQKAMEVCDVCGAFLIVGDAQQRIDDHLLGKQHVGYARLRAVTDKIMEERRKHREEREAGRPKKSEDDEKRRKRSRSPPPSSSSSSNPPQRRRSRERRDHHHHRRRRSNERRRSSPERRRRSRSPRSRSRSRDRSGGRKHKRHHRSRSRSGDRHRRRSRSRGGRRRSRS